jgi:hypothetical protein
MIPVIVNNLGEKITATKIYSKVICFAEMSIDGEGKVQPKAYTSAGQLQNVSDFDNAAGVCYFRKNGKIQMQRSTDENTTRTACEEMLLLTIPLRFVGMVPKKLFTDDAFTDDRIALQIIKALEEKHAAIISQLQARTVSIEVLDYDTDSINILSEEYKGIERKDFNYNMSYIAVNFQANILLSKECFDNCIT